MDVAGWRIKTIYYAMARNTHSINWIRYLQMDEGLFLPIIWHTWTAAL